VDLVTVMQWNNHLDRISISLNRTEVPFILSAE